MVKHDPDDGIALVIAFDPDDTITVLIQKGQPKVIDRRILYQLYIGFLCIQYINHKLYINAVEDLTLRETIASIYCFAISTVMQDMKRIKPMNIHRGEQVRRSGTVVVDNVTIGHA